MSDRIYKLDGSGTAGLDPHNAVVSADIQADGFIEGVLGILDGFGMDALSDNAAAELSFMSTNTFGTNDTRGSIMMVRCRQNFLTSGGGANANNVFVAFGQKGIKVNAGERIYVHTQAAAGVTPKFVFYVYVRESGSARSSERRR